MRPQSWEKQGKAGEMLGKWLAASEIHL